MYASRTKYQACSMHLKAYEEFTLCLSLNPHDNYETDMSGAYKWTRHSDSRFEIARLRARLMGGNDEPHGGQRMATQTRR